jgi:hypothetical protein
VTDPTPRSFSVFAGHRRIAWGALDDAARAVRRSVDAGVTVLVFDDATGALVDLDPRGDDAEGLARLPLEAPPEAPRSRGRPRLGVVPREVTLMPRHWDWLNAQPGGASVALRKLVEAARKADGAAERSRDAKAAAYRFLAAIAGDLPGFEEAARALFADDRRAFTGRIAAWPQDVRDHAIRLAFADLDAGGA